MNVLIIVFSLIFLTPNTMLNNDQAKVIQETYQSYQALVAHCKQHNLDINTILSPAQKKQLKGGMEFLKIWMPEVKKVMDIPKPVFGSEMSKWIGYLLSYYQKIGADDITPTKVKEFKEKLSESFSPDPVNQFVLSKLLEAIPDSPAVEKRINLANALEKVLKPMYSDAYWEDLFKNNKTLRKHYRKDKSMVDLLPVVANVGDALLHKDVEDKDDPNHPDNIAAKKATAAAKQAAYEKRLDDWKKEEVAKLEFSSYDDTCYITPTKLDLEDTKWVTFDEKLPAALKKNLLEAIKKGAVKETSDNSIIIAVAGDVGQAAVNKFRDANINEIKNYEELTLEEINALVFPTGLDAWIANADYHTKEKKDRKTKKELLAEIFDAWKLKEQTALGDLDTYAHRKINIEKLKDSTINTALLPEEIKTKLLASIKEELKGVNPYSKITSSLIKFLGCSDFSTIVFDEKAKQPWYENLSKKEITQIQFPQGLKNWLLAAKESYKKDTTPETLDGYKDKFLVWSDSIENLNTDFTSTMAKYNGLFNTASDTYRKAENDLKTLIESCDATYKSDNDGIVSSVGSWCRTIGMGAATVTAIFTSEVTVPIIVAVGVLSEFFGEEVTDAVVLKDTTPISVNTSAESLYEAIMLGENKKILDASTGLKKGLNTIYQECRKVRNGLANAKIEKKKAGKEVLDELKVADFQMGTYYKAVSTLIKDFTEKVDAIKLEGLEAKIFELLLKDFILNNIKPGDGKNTIFECAKFVDKLRELGLCTEDDFVDTVIPGEFWSDDVDRLLKKVKEG